MDILAPFVFTSGPKRVVHIARSLDHLYFLHKNSPLSHLLALPPQFRWMDIKHCWKCVDVKRVCATMGKPNPLWSMEVVYYTPVKRLLIENRLIDFESAPTLEVVDIQRY